MKNKHGDILIENVLFLAFYIIFLAMLMVFVYSRGNSAMVIEQSYAKNIALLIDSAKPVMEMKLNMEDAFDIAEDNKIDKNKIVTINDNVVFVKLSSKSGYEYSFFTDFDVTVYPDVSPNKNYIIKINGYK